MALTPRFPLVDPPAQRTKTIATYGNSEGLMTAVIGGGILGLLSDNGWGFIIGGIVSFTIGYGYYTRKITGAWLVWCIFMALLVAFICGGHTGPSPAYSGIVSEVKQLKNGVIIDIDGDYPDQKMMVFVPKASQGIFNDLDLPYFGQRIDVYGPVVKFRGMDEIVVTRASQLVLHPT